MSWWNLQKEEKQYCASVLFSQNSFCEHPHYAEASQTNATFAGTGQLFSATSETFIYGLKIKITVRMHSAVQQTQITQGETKFVQATL